jgi:hypothetical protein
MRFRHTGVTVAVVGVISSLALNACGSGSLSASSTCQDFMKASASEQHEIIDQLASRYDKPDFTSPLGEPEVPYYCTANPSVTLDQFFQKAEG